MMSTLLRCDRASLWEKFCCWITSTEKRLYIGWFDVLMIPVLLVATLVFGLAFVAAPPVDIGGVRKSVSGSLLYGNNLISALDHNGNVIPTWADVLNRANLGIEVMHERNAHNFPLDLAAGPNQPIALLAPSIG